MNLGFHGLTCLSFSILKPVELESKLFFIAVYFYLFFFKLWLPPSVKDWLSFFLLLLKFEFQFWRSRVNNNFILNFKEFKINKFLPHSNFQTEYEIRNKQYVKKFSKIGEMIVFFADSKSHWFVVQCYTKYKKIM